MSYRLRILLTTTLSALTLLVAIPAKATTDPRDVGIEGPSHLGTSTPTGTKRAESVLWHNDDFWWGVLWDADTSDFHIFRLDRSTQQWIDTNVAADTRAYTHHDVLSDSSALYIASHKFVDDEKPAVAGFPSRLYRYKYDSRANTYSPLGYTKINDYKTETLVIDKDTLGRVWATWAQEGQVYLNATATDGKSWGVPFTLPGAGGISVDDNSALLAFGSGRIGVMWSRQLGNPADGFYWSVHRDGDPPNVWTLPTVVTRGSRIGDDHINLKRAGSSSRVFATVKLSLTKSTDPLVQLLAKDVTGQWTAHTIATVAECPNRAIVLVDGGMLRTFATYPQPAGAINAGVCTSAGGAIYEKSTPISNINFTTAKVPRIVDADQYVHNVSSTKQSTNTERSGLAIIADNGQAARYWHHFAGGGG